MKKAFIVANWKSNKTIEETEKWLHVFQKGFLSKESVFEGKTVIISPSFTLLEHANYCSSNLKLPIRFAAQNISPFSEGQYTGEVSGRQIKEFSDYIIVGHSERRRYFHETNRELESKVAMSIEYGLIPIFCIQGSKTPIPKDVEIVAYEPIFAIGSGNSDTPENANLTAELVKKQGIKYVLYGGSVTSKNVKSFTTSPNIDGVLVGTASLDALEFFKILQNA